MDSATAEAGPSKEAVLAAMMADIGVDRQNELVLDDRHHEHKTSYRPNRNPNNKSTKVDKAALAAWSALASNGIDDSESHMVRNLEDLGGARLYDTVNNVNTAIQKHFNVPASKARSPGIRLDPCRRPGNAHSNVKVTASGIVVDPGAEVKTFRNKKKGKSKSAVSVPPVTGSSTSPQPRATAPPAASPVPYQLMENPAGLSVQHGQSSRHLVDQQSAAITPSAPAVEQLASSPTRIAPEQMIPETPKPAASESYRQIVRWEWRCQRQGPQGQTSAYKLIILVVKTNNGNLKAGCILQSMDNRNVKFMHDFLACHEADIDSATCRMKFQISESNYMDHVLLLDNEADAAEILTKLNVTEQALKLKKFATDHEAQISETLDTSHLRTQTSSNSAQDEEAKLTSAAWADAKDNIIKGFGLEAVLVNEKIEQVLQVFFLLQLHDTLQSAGEADEPGDSDDEHQDEALEKMSQKSEQSAAKSADSTNPPVHYTPTEIQAQRPYAKEPQASAWEYTKGIKSSKGVKSFKHLAPTMPAILPSVEPDNNTTSEPGKCADQKQDAELSHTKGSFVKTDNEEDLMEFANLSLEDRHPGKGTSCQLHDDENSERLPAAQPDDGGLDPIQVVKNNNDVEHSPLPGDQEIVAAEEIQLSRTPMNIGQPAELLPVLPNNSQRLVGQEDQLDCAATENVMNTPQLTSVAPFATSGPSRQVKVITTKEWFDADAPAGTPPFKKMMMEDTYMESWTAFVPTAQLEDNVLNQSASRPIGLSPKAPAFKPKQLKGLGSSKYADGAPDHQGSGRFTIPF